MFQYTLDTLDKVILYNIGKLLTWELNYNKELSQYVFEEIKQKIDITPLIITFKKYINKNLTEESLSFFLLNEIYEIRVENPESVLFNTVFYSYLHKTLLIPIITNKDTSNIILKKSKELAKINSKISNNIYYPYIVKQRHTTECVRYLYCLYANIDNTKKIEHEKKPNEAYLHCGNMTFQQISIYINSGNDEIIYEKDKCCILF